MNQPLLSIVIPTYNRPEKLTELLTSVRDQSGLRKNKSIFEIIIRDNNSDINIEDTISVFKNDLSIKFSKNKTNIGGIKNLFKVCIDANGKFVFLMSDDDLLCKNTLSKIFNILKKYPEIGVISGPQKCQDDNAVKQCNKIVFNKNNKDILLGKGYDAFINLFLRATSISGLIINKDLVDINGAKKHKNSLYPQIYLVGKATKTHQAYYFSDPIVKIRINEKKYWEYEADFNAEAIVNVLKSLTKDVSWGKKAYKKIIKQRILYSYAPLKLQRLKTTSDFINTIKALSKIEDYRHSIIFWIYVVIFSLLGKKGIKTIKRVKKYLLYKK
jgi:glycosyltransferase involved in cell wall biosynthesis